MKCLLRLALGLMTIAYQSPGMATPKVGVDVHLWASGTGEINTKLSRAAAVGSTIARWDVPWKAIEKSRGVLVIPANLDVAVQEAKRRGIEPLLILDYGNSLYDGGHRPISPEAIAAYVRYANAIVTHFKSQVRLFEIWNEWNENNGDSGVGTPDEYLNLLRATYPSVKRIAPNATFLVGGSSRLGMDSFDSQKSTLIDRDKYHFLDHLFASGMLKYGDALSIHPYVRSESTSDAKVASFQRMLAGVSASVAKYTQGRPYPIFITEIGWPTAQAASGEFVTQGDQLLLTKRILQSVCAFPAVQGVMFFELENSGTDPSRTGDNYGFFDRSGHMKAAAPPLPKPSDLCRR